ncbi:LCP family protein [Lysinibacillus sp. BF-4]|uniref:LCP family protein n=1 Tax=Lysinibacillus sp. BF-4 TaxID=1473546 RepID=UPI0009DF7DD9|nr:LCP family protein [Lysinibacillus sp. BF-4]
MTKQKKRRSTRLTTIVKALLIIATIALLCVAIYAVYLTKQAEVAVTQAHEKLDGRENSSKRDGKVEPLKDNLSILLIGVDDSEVRQQGADNSRSDALMLATLNNKTKTVKLVSIPRDAYVHIPALGYSDKITHSHSKAGTLGTIETVEELFDVPVDYYVRMNFNAFIDVVDALDGVEAKVPYELLEKDEFDRTAVHLMPGKQTLNGSEALAFARTRKQDTDVDRGKRQQELVQAIAKKAASMGSLLKYDDVLRAVGDNMKTDLTFSEIKSLLYYLSKGMPQIDTLVLEGEDVNLPEGYYYQVDEASREMISEKLHKHLGLPPKEDFEPEASLYE